MYRSISKESIKHDNLFHKPFLCFHFFLNKNYPYEESHLAWREGSVGKVVCNVSLLG